MLVPCYDGTVMTGTPAPGSVTIDLGKVSVLSPDIQCFEHRSMRRRRRRHAAAIIVPFSVFVFALLFLSLSGFLILGSGPARPFSVSPGYHLHCGPSSLISSLTTLTLRLCHGCFRLQQLTMCASSALASACVPSTFSNITLFGAEILQVDAQLVTNFSATSYSLYRYVQPTVELTNATFCNVTISYTHPGEDDNIGVETWLPVAGWNNRYMGAGGGGWVAGRGFLSYYNMYGALADGFATSTTDAGLHPLDSQDATPWALLSVGNVNLYDLENLAARSLSDQVRWLP